MYKMIKEFFNPQTYTYRPGGSKAALQTKLQNYFDERQHPISTKELYGQFINNDSFTVGLVSKATPIPARLHTPTLIGDLTEDATGQVEIRTIIKTNSFFMILACLGIGIAIFYTSMSLLSGYAGGLLITSAALLIWPLLMMLVSAIAKTAIRTKFEKLIAN